MHFRRAPLSFGLKLVSRDISICSWKEFIWFYFLEGRPFFAFWIFFCIFSFSFRVFLETRQIWARPSSITMARIWPTLDSEAASSSLLTWTWSNLVLMIYRGLSPPLIWRDWWMFIPIHLFSLTLIPLTRMASTSASYSNFYVKMSWVKYRVKRTYQNTDISTEYFDLLFGHSYSVLFRYSSPACSVDDISNAQDIEHVPDIITVFF